jgi:hypothetical protein
MTNKLQNIFLLARDGYKYDSGRGWFDRNGKYLINQTLPEYDTDNERRMALLHMSIWRPTVCDLVYKPPPPRRRKRCFGHTEIGITRRTAMKDKCEHCGTELIDKCPWCGAPVCCPRCCEETRKEDSDD